MKQLLMTCVPCSASGAFGSMDPTTTAWGTEFTTANGSDLTSFSLMDEETLILGPLTFVIGSLGLAGNAIVLWFLGFRMRRNPFTVYILNLAGADFLFLCFQIINYVDRLLCFLHLGHYFMPTFFTAVWILAYLTGLSTLSAISTERCLSVVWPIWYRCRRPRHTSGVTCALLWAVSLLLSILEGDRCGFLFREMDYDDYSWCRILDFIIAAWLFVLFVLLSGSSLTLLIRILCGSRRMPLTKLYVTIVLTVLVFLLLGLPFGIHWFLLIWIGDFQYTLPFDLTSVTLVFSCVNSCANPFIYFFVGSFRQRRWRPGTLKLVLQRAMQDTPEEDECGNGTSSGNPGETETVFV